MGSKKIIVPQGLINPNETTIIEIPHGVDSEATLIARSTPSEDPNNCSNPKYGSKHKSKPKAYATEKSSDSPRMITKVTSTTVFQTNDDGDEVMTSRTNKEEYRSQGRNMYRSGQINPYQDQSRYTDSYMHQQTSDYESYDHSKSSNQCAPNKNLCSDPSCPVVSSLMETRNSSFNPTASSSRYQATSYLPQQSYDYSSYQQPKTSNQCAPNKNLCNDASCPVVSSMNESRNSRALPSTMYSSQAASYNSYAGYQSPRQRVKIVRKVITDAPSYPPASQAGSRISRFNPPLSNNQIEHNEEDSGTCTTCSGGGNDSQNLRTQVEKHLAEIEESERERINRDLAIFQQARRRLVEDATNISSGESNIQFKK